MNVLDKIRLYGKANKAPVHKLLMHKSEVEEAKSLGAYYSREHNCMIVKTEDIANHPCNKFTIENFVEVTYPYNVKEDFEELGCFSRKGDDGKWRNYIRLCEENVEKIEVLLEGGFIKDGQDKRDINAGQQGVEKDV